MRVAFRLVDVFTDRSLAGNQLCVFPDPTGLPAALMRAVAKEIGFSETTFVTAASGDRYEMRIFTPGPGARVRRCPDGARAKGRSTWMPDRPAARTGLTAPPTDPGVAGAEGTGRPTGRPTRAARERCGS